MNAKAKLLEALERLPLIWASLVAGLGSWLISLFLYAPPLWLPFFGGANLRMRPDDYLIQCANPLARHKVDAILYYRITSPTIAWLLGLKGYWAFSIQYVAIPAFLAVIFYAVAKRTDRSFAGLITLGISLTYTCIWPDATPGFPDSVTHLAVAIMLLSSSPLLAAVLTILGMLNDERMILAFPFLIMWHFPFNTIAEAFVKSWTFVLGITSGLVVVMIVRHALSVGWIGEAFSIPFVYVQMSNNLHEFSPVVGWFPYFADLWFSFRYLWLVALFYLVSNKTADSWLPKAFFLVSFLANFIAMLPIADIAKGVCFAYPGLLVAGCSLYRIEAIRLRKLCNLCIFLCVITPNIYMMSDWNLFWNRPLLVALIQRWDNVDLLSPLRAKYPILNHIEP